MTSSKIEAKKRVDEAKYILEHIVQNALGEAANKLSRIVWCPEYDDIDKLYDQVKALWHKLDQRSRSPKIDLDESAKAKFESRE